MISNALMYPCVTTVNQCGCIYPGISMITTYVYQFCQPTYSQDIYRCLCQTYVGVHPPTYSQGEYSCIYLLHQNTYIQGFYHWSNGVVGTAYTRITEWFICIYLYPGFVQSVYSSPAQNTRLPNRRNITMRDFFPSMHGFHTDLFMRSNF